MEPHEISDTEAEAFLTERFKELPKAVQDAILSADISKHLQELAKTHQLHVDQWDVLEREVQLTLLGLQPLAELAHNLAEELHMPLEQTIPLANDISAGVFQPIREELERQLEHPEAKEAQLSAVEAAREQALAAVTPENASAGETPRTVPVQSASLSADTAPAAVPAAQPAATPAPAAPAATPASIARAPVVSASYGTGSASHERREVEGDPYREQIT